MKKLNPILEKRAVDLNAHTPNIKHREVANQLEISDKTLMKQRKDGNFWDKVYSTFMQSFEGELPDILRAMCREAKAGNQMAARLVLEHSGKLQKNIHVTIASPFEQWLAQSGNNQTEEAEIVLDTLPHRTAENTPETTQNDLVKLDRVIQKKQAWNTRRRELHKWVKRAEAVGITTLPARRPTKGQRLEWEMSIIQAEDEQSNTNAES